MKMFMIFAVLVCSLVGCNQGMITVDAIDDSVQDIVTRHDAYVNADASLSAVEKRTYLRSSELLLRVLKEAKKPTTAFRNEPDVNGYFVRSNIRATQRIHGGPLGATTVPVTVAVPVRR